MRNEDVRSRFGLDSGEFFITAQAACPYLAGKKERKIFAYLGGPEANSTNAALTNRGFRRSQNIIYMPACEACQACVPVRIRTEDFELSGSRARVLRRNADLARRLRPPKATSRQFSVLRGYLDARHEDGGMADMTMLDYASMVEETAVDTLVAEYSITDKMGEERLVACGLTDRLSDGLSMVYSFFEPDESQRSLGRYMILDHVRLARTLGLPYVYLGYWVQGSAKMAYKSDYQPLEYLSPSGWAQFDVQSAQCKSRRA